MGREMANTKAKTKKRVHTDGSRALARRMLENDLSALDVAKALSTDALPVTRVAVHYWSTGQRRPSSAYRDNIESWSQGTIPATSWATAKERRARATVETRARA